MRKLTPTSYAILGLLGLRPWSAYELTKQVRRSLHFCWPRAETRLYQEPKNLVEHGLVEAATVSNGRRARTDYTITAEGRRALRSWLAEGSAPPRLESEALLRVFFAEHGTKDALLATLTELEAQARADRTQAVTQAAEYLAGRGAGTADRPAGRAQADDPAGRGAGTAHRPADRAQPSDPAGRGAGTAHRAAGRAQAGEGGAGGSPPFPERAHILALFGRFTLAQTALLIDWARWARAEVERWPDTTTGEPSPEVLRAFEEALAEIKSDGVPADR